MSEEMAMIKINGIKKSFGKTEVLKGIDLDVKEGDVVAILGPSGSGKTTLLRCINMLEKADEGQLVFDGVTYNLGHMHRKDIAKIRKKTAFVFQNYNLFANKTALQNVTLGLTSARGMKKDEAEKIAREMLDKVGLLDKQNNYPGQLSGGQQQRVAIARALITHPSVIFADEPTGNLDAASAETVARMLTFAASKYQQTIVMVTHDRQMAEYADRILTITDGNVTGGVGV